MHQIINLRCHIRPAPSPDVNIEGFTLHTHLLWDEYTAATPYRCDIDTILNYEHVPDSVTRELRKNLDTPGKGNDTEVNTSSKHLPDSFQWKIFLQYRTSWTCYFFLLSGRNAEIGRECLMYPAMGVLPYRVFINPKRAAS